MYTRGDIYKADIPYTSEHVYYGVRPVLIVSNDIGNRKGDIIQCCPITTKMKNGLPTHIDIRLNRPSTIMCEQIITLSNKCLLEPMNTLGKDEMKRVDIALRLSLGLA